MTYSVWHRRLDGNYRMIDIDSVEVCHKCYTPIVLLELAVYKGQWFKQYYVLRNLARMAKVPAYIVLYEKACEDDSQGAISNFYVRQVHPKLSQKYFKIQSGDYAQWLAKLHKKCKHCGYNSKKTS